MAEQRIYPVTYVNEDKEKWIKEQLIFRYRDEKPASTFLDLRGIYQSKRDRKRDLEQCKNKPQQGKFAELGKIEY